MADQEFKEEVRLIHAMGAKRLAEGEGEEGVKPAPYASLHLQLFVLFIILFVST